MPLGAVIVNRVLPELFTHADEETFEALREPDASTRRSLTAPAAGATAVLDAARLAVSLRRTRVGAPRAPARARSTSRCCYVPYLFVRDHGLRVTRMVADALGAGARPVTPTPDADAAASLEQLLAAKEIVVFCGSGGVGKTSVAAAAALGAASRLGGKVLVLTIDPAKRLADRARARRHRQRRATGCRPRC